MAEEDPRHVMLQFGKVEGKEGGGGGGREGRREGGRKCARTHTHTHKTQCGGDLFNVDIRWPLSPIQVKP